MEVLKIKKYIPDLLADIWGMIIQPVVTASSLMKLEKEEQVSRLFFFFGLALFVVVLTSPNFHEGTNIDWLAVSKLIMIELIAIFSLTLSASLFICRTENQAIRNITVAAFSMTSILLIFGSFLSTFTNGLSLLLYPELFIDPSEAKTMFLDRELFAKYIDEFDWENNIGYVMIFIFSFTTDIVISFFYYILFWLALENFYPQIRQRFFRVILGCYVINLIIFYTFTPFVMYVLLT